MKLKIRYNRFGDIELVTDNQFEFVRVYTRTSSRSKAAVEIRKWRNEERIRKEEERRRKIEESKYATVTVKYFDLYGDEDIISKKYLISDGEEGRLAALRAARREARSEVSAGSGDRLCPWTKAS